MGIFVIRNCNVLEHDGITDVMVQDGVIKSIGQAGADIADGIDARGRFLMPGLIDCHVHLILDSSPDTVSYVETGKLESAAERNSLDSLRAGITTVRDMGCSGFIVPRLRDRIRSGQCAGPRIVACGHMITEKSGHVKTIARETDRTPPDIRKAVQEQVDGGADFIKLIASGGILTPGTHPRDSELDQGMLEAAVKEAKRIGVKTAVHAYSDTDVRNSIGAGAWTIEHGSWSSAETLNAAAASNTFLVPTVKAAQCIIENSDSLPDHVVRNASSVLDATRSLVPRALKQGVTIVMGTDAGTPFNRHGKNAEELEYLSELGMSNKELIAAATVNGSGLLGMPDIGRVEKGCRADLILLDKNPLDDIKALKNVKHVIKDGKLIR